VECQSTGQGGAHEGSRFYGVDGAAQNVLEIVAKSEKGTNQ
jgi:hypothetical protein